MSRVIKFRAWDEGSERFLEHFDFVRYSDGTLGVSDSTPPFNKYGKIGLTQSTGLHDKNGTEIYEGDICHIGDGGECFPIDWDDNDESYNPGKYEVYFDNACFWIRGVGGTETPELEWTPWGYAEFEVIGNIYENPDLLEAKS